MLSRTHFPQLVLIFTLLTALCAWTFSPHSQAVEAKPSNIPAATLVLSEFRTTGPNGGNDEFIEIYNPTNSAIPLGGLKLRKSSGCGTTLTDIHTFAPVNLFSGQHYLVASLSYAGSSAPDVLLPTNMGIADNGGIAITDSADIPIDQVGMCPGTMYKEPSDGSGILSPMTSTDGVNNKSYERKLAACTDSNNNLADFTLISASNPQNSSVPITPCLYITNVTSSKSDGIYTSGEIIDIDVTFSNNVNVAGSPILILETGTPDHNAVYLMGSDGDATITFRYTVSDTDSTTDLDYASTASLSLSGGSITGAVGNSLLDLPVPGTSGSLGFNKDIKIDAVGNPRIVSFTKQTPSGPITTSNSLTFRAIFSESVLNVDSSDFVVLGLSGTTVFVNPINGNTYDISVSGGNINTFNGTVGLDISPTVSIVDLSLPGNPLPATPEPLIDETFTLDNSAPTAVTINQAPTQLDPTLDQPVLFTLTFSEVIDGSTFVASDISQIGTASGVTWHVSPTSDPTVYNLSATASSSGTLIPSIPANRFKDLAGNDNVAFVDGNCTLPEPNNCITLNITNNPSVIINQLGTQLDPTNTLPIKFTVKFSEPINTATFTTSDVTQTGTATGVVWSLINSGDNLTFSLSATSTTGFGTIAPSIAANRILDLSGNNNTASTSLDNTVNYIFVPPTRTPTPTPPVQARAVVINEVAWAGTSSALPDDEWIELYNPGKNGINLAGWSLRALDGSPDISLSGNIAAKGYFLLERDNDDTVLDIKANQLFTGALANTGEILILYDPSNRIIDTANSTGGSWPAGNSDTYGSMERISITSESDSTWKTNTGITYNGKNANGGDILGTPKRGNSPSPTATPTSLRTATPTFTPIITPIVIPPRPIINEILARPGFDWNQDGKADVFDEFIEIKNLTAADISLSGWKLDTVNGKKSFSLPDVTLKPGERVVFYSKQTNLLLSDGGETVRLSNSSGKIYDAFTYTVARAEDESFCRLPDGNPGDSWFEDCLPTPNLTNTHEGQTPTSPDGNASPVCNLPDTIPVDFFIPECNGYGGRIWNPFYWDFVNWIDKLWIQQTDEKWRSYFE